MSKIAIANLAYAEKEKLEHDTKMIIEGDLGMLSEQQAQKIIGSTETPEQKKLRELFESLKNIRWR